MQRRLSARTPQRCACFALDPQPLELIHRLQLTDDVITEVENDDDSTWLSVLGAMYYSSGSTDPPRD